MKALALDTATGRISAAAYNGSTHASLILNLELRQSEKLLPAVETVLREAELAPTDLDFVALTSGPGSFTGLRLGFAALKAFQLSTGCPLYGVPTLQAYFYPFRDKRILKDAYFVDNVLMICECRFEECRKCGILNCHAIHLFDICIKNT